MPTQAETTETRKKARFWVSASVHQVTPIIVKCAESGQLSLIAAPTVYTFANNQLKVNWFDLPGRKSCCGSPHICAPAGSRGSQS